ncbi:MAG: hypothetical protein JW751_27115 [Polyangiaceae bacterium]|nr:hypothetical protein [Polyangiaceae bacterium]
MATTGDAPTGGTGGAGGCQKSTTAGNEVVIIGESFIAMSSIPETIEGLAAEDRKRMEREGRESLLR